MADPLTSNGSRPPTSAEWKAAMGYFPTGVTIVTSWDDGVPVGSTVNAFCSVSLEPPMLLICLDQVNPIRIPIERSRVFGINFLGEEDGHGLAMRFSKAPQTRKIEGFEWQAADKGAPQMRTAPVFVDCVLENSYPAGDHFIMVGRGVRTVQASACQPLLYHGGRFPTISRAS